MNSKAIYPLTTFLIIAGGYFSTMLVLSGSSQVSAVLGLVLLTVVAFSIPESKIPFALVLILMLGSCYRWDVSQKSFWARFLFLFFIDARVLISFLSKSPTFMLENPKRRFTFLHITFV